MSVDYGVLLFVVLFAAVAAGWFIGFRQGRFERRREEAGKVRQWVQSLAREGESTAASSLAAVARTLAFNNSAFSSNRAHYFVRSSARRLPGCMAMN